MNIEQLRSQFDILAISQDQGQRDSVEEALLKEGFNIQLTSTEELFLAKMSEKPAHVVLVDLMGIDWTLKKLVESTLEVSTETLFVFLGPIDLFERVQIYREFGLYQFVDQKQMGGSYLVWVLDSAIQSLYSRYQNEALLAQPISETLPSSSFIECENTSQLFQRLFDKIESKSWKLLHFQFFEAKGSIVLESAFGIPIDPYKSVGLQNSEMRNLDFATDVGFQNLLSTVFKVKASVCRPLYRTEEFVGVAVAFSESGGEDQSLVENLMDEFTKYFNRISMLEKLTSLSVWDEEFLLASESHYQRCLEEEISRSRRLKLPVSMIVLSIDEYPTLLAEQGEERAHSAFRLVAQLVKKTSRAHDVSQKGSDGVIRILLPHTNLKGAGVRAERLRRIIAQADPVKDLKLSLGVSEYPSASKNPQSLEATAVKAMHQVKDRGGNKVCLAAPSKGFKPDFVVRLDSP